MIDRTTEYIQVILHDFSQVLMVPVLVLLIALILASIVLVVSIAVEFFVERRHFKVDLPDAINAVEQAEFAELNTTLCGTRLLWAQKSALLMVTNNAGLPDDALFALAKSELSEADLRYRKMVGRSDLLTKIAPMMGLMATLIPLGPGIVAMGQGDVEALSTSLAMAFDGTVTGLVAAVVSMCVSHVRKRWYGQYRSALESMMTTLLEKIDLEREKGVELPAGFSRSDLDPFQKRARELVLASESASFARKKGFRSAKTVDQNEALPDEDGGRSA